MVMQEINSDKSYSIDSNEFWIKSMRSGAFEKAWEFSDEVLKSGINRDYQSLPRHYQCIWDGTPLNGKRVLIRCYHGLGDTIQFIRYAPLLKEVAKEVIVWAQPALLEILETMEGIDRLIPLHDGVPDVEYDEDAEIMELPHIFRTTLVSIPQNIPYIQVEPLLLSNNLEQMSVGLVWQAGNWAPERNIPFSLLKPLFGINGIQLYILQANAQMAEWHDGLGIHPGEFNLYDYARVISGLDLLLTVDSMPAHLAGALNIPVWILLQKEADWRWLEDREDSPWYPSMKIFRQEKQGNWEMVIEKVVEKLNTKVECH